MLDIKYLKGFEKKIIEANEKNLNKEFVSYHFETMLKFAGGVLSSGRLRINDYQYKIYMHLFNLTNHLDYIPSL